MRTTIILLVLLTVTGAQMLRTPRAVLAVSCGDFGTQRAAQEYLRLYPLDPDRLDNNNNGVACEGVLQCPCDYTAVPRTTTAGVPTAIPTVIGSSSATLTPTPTPSATPTATATPPANIFVSTPSGTALACPASGQWLGLYWSGGATPIATAIRTCQTADLAWARQASQWRGYAVQAASASDTYDVGAGEFVFVRGK